MTTKKQMQMQLQKRNAGVSTTRRTMKLSVASVEMMSHFHGLGGKRTFVRISHCWELFASDTLLERAVREKYL
jgi:hypothetical protein